MYIRHNIAALNTTRQLTNANKGIQKNAERLSTSLKINHAGDDAAGLSISEKMRSQISGLDKSAKNANDSISLIQTAEGALAEVHNMLIRGRELAVQSANDTNTDEDREHLQKELDQLLDAVDRIGMDTEFNTKKLLDGSQSGLVFHLGANSSQNIEFSVNEISTNSLNIGGIVINSQNSANDALSGLDEAAKQVSEQRAHLGALQNRLGHTITNNDQTGSNLTAADSVIRDANVAEEAMKLTKNEILRDTMQSIMTHSNVKNDGVLQLLN
jgi:flagellin